MRARAFLLLAAAGCVSLDLPMESTGGAPVVPPPPPTGSSAIRDVGAADAGSLRLLWPEPRDPTYAAWREAMLRDGRFEAWFAHLDEALALPHDVPILHEECGIANAFYDPERRSVHLCYELLEVVASVMAREVGGADAPAATGGAWLFVALHETGHALVDAYDLPVTGREEDAVDDFAALVLLHDGAPDAALDAATFWGLTEDWQTSAEEFADEHSLNAQRYFALLCDVVGADPEGYGWIVDEGYLPESRAARCVYEHEKKAGSWARLLDDAWVEERTLVESETSRGSL
ncbi:MAG TPA: DUF4344 domain-containing metallopeptidase [Candidatus Thermoplasmatota archaeon]|nr:DUF4344 domain-containing metallopeptidase [Candidatus Thermoplasmatota archaeon]